jgi:hypothetical protein
MTVAGSGKTPPNGRRSSTNVGSGNRSIDLARRDLRCRRHAGDRGRDAYPGYRVGDRSGHWNQTRRNRFSAHLDCRSVACFIGNPSLARPSGSDGRRRCSSRRGRRAVDHCRPLGPFQLVVGSRPTNIGRRTNTDSVLGRATRSTVERVIDAARAHRVDLLTCGVMQQRCRENHPVRLRVGSGRSGVTPGAQFIPRHSNARGVVRFTDLPARTAGLVATRCCTRRCLVAS